MTTTHPFLRGTSKNKFGSSRSQSLTQQQLVQKLRNLSSDMDMDAKQVREYENTMKVLDSAKRDRSCKKTLMFISRLHPIPDLNKAKQQLGYFHIETKKFMEILAAYNDAIHEATEKYNHYDNKSITGRLRRLLFGCKKIEELLHKVSDLRTQIKTFLTEQPDSCKPYIAANMLLWLNGLRLKDSTSLYLPIPNADGSLVYKVVYPLYLPVLLKPKPSQQSVKPGVRTPSMIKNIKVGTFGGKQYLLPSRPKLTTNAVASSRKETDLNTLPLPRALPRYRMVVPPRNT